MEILSSFFIAVVSDVVAYFIIKWLDSNGRR